MLAVAPVMTTVFVREGFEDFERWIGAELCEEAGVVTVAEARFTPASECALDFIEHSRGIQTLNLFRAENRLEPICLGGAHGT